VTVISAFTSQGSTSQPSGSVVGNIGTLASGATATMTVVVMTSASNPPSITNTVTGSANELDPAGADNTASATTQVTAVADLAVNIVAPTSPVQVNQNVTYTVTVSNNGPSSATGVTLTDTLPTGATFVSARDDRGNQLTPVNGTLVDNIGALAFNGTVTLTIVVTATDPGVLIESASVAGNEPDTTTANDTSLVTTTVIPVADLSVIIAADQSQVTSGQQVTFTVTVTNDGPSPATGVTLDDTFTGGVTIVSATPSQGSVSEGNGSLTASFGDMAPGSTATLTVVVVPTVPGSLTDQATVSGNETDSNTFNNSATTGVLVVEPSGVLAFASTSFTVNENAGNASILVTRTGGAQGAVSVKFNVVPGGTGVAGVDFKPVSGTLVFNQGETTKVIVVPVLANPHDKHDETVKLALSSPSGGALLGAPAATTLIIHDIDPDLVSPTIQDLRLFGPASSIVDVALFFSEPLNATSASRLAGFQVFDAGTDGLIGTRDDRSVALKAPIYNASNNTVTLQPTVPMKANEFYYVRLNGVTDRAGNPIAAGPGATSSAFASYFARGTSLRYPDSHGSLVSINVAGGGLVDVTRFANGEGQRLQLLNFVTHRTVLSGSVKGGSGATTFDSFTGLGVFGQVRVKMTTPPFFVTHMPFFKTIISPPSVDGVFLSGGVTVPKKPATRKVHR
jgi:uncharacterized repeat protein (TIGR01451 family)